MCGRGKFLVMLVLVSLVVAVAKQNGRISWRDFWDSGKDSFHDSHGNLIYTVIRDC